MIIFNADLFLVMQKVKLALLFPLLTFLLSCQENKSTSNQAETAREAAIKPAKIQVLNFGTFHMGLTSDANTTEFNEHDKKNIAAVHEVAKKLATFKPTVIVVETSPQNDDVLQAEYAEYLMNPNMHFAQPSEVELLAYELGRLSGVKEIYGIDHKMGYNYRIGEEIENKIDSTTYRAYVSNPFSANPELEMQEDSLTLMDKLILTNKDAYLDFLMTINADILTHAGTEGNYEGADEAAKFYQRNLRMYSNLNRLPLQKDDRVFVLMGAAHTAFFKDFMRRSPKYEMVNTFEYLK